MSDKIYHQTVEKMGKTIDRKWLNAHMQLLEKSPVYAPFSWGWCSLMADSRQMREDIALRAQAAYNSKPFGCELCEEQEATMYHCYVGRVCPDCHATLPKE